MAQWAVLGVSIFEFRGVTSPMFFQNSTPMFQPMSIEKSKFAACSQYNLASIFQNLFCEALFFVYCPANFEVAQATLEGKQMAGIAPSLCMDIQFSARL